MLYKINNFHKLFKFGSLWKNILVMVIMIFKLLSFIKFVINDLEIDNKQAINYNQNHF